MNDYTDPEDERMRELLNDAVSHVEPRESLDSIRARTVVTPFRRRRPWILGAGAAVVATAATVTAVAVTGGTPGTTNQADPNFAGPSSVLSTGPTGPSGPTGPTGAPSTAEGSGLPSTTDSAAPSPDDDPTSSGGSSDSSSASSPQVLRAVPVYYVGETSRGPRLYREFHELATSATDPGVALGSALDAALSTAPADPDYGTDWPAGATATGTFDGEVITIDLDGEPQTSLHDRPAGMSEAQAQLAVEQLVYTAQGVVQNRAPVQFLISGDRTDAVLGVPASEPLAEGDPNSVLAQVWVIEPVEGAEVSVPFKVSGLANAFEANVQWELMQGDEVVANGFTMAAEAFTMAPYSFRVKDVPPGEYTLVVHDEDASGGAEGAGSWQDTKNITVVE